MYDKRTAGQYIVVTLREERLYIRLEGSREVQRKRCREEQKKVEKDIKKGEER